MNVGMCVAEDPAVDKKFIWRKGWKKWATVNILAYLWVEELWVNEKQKPLALCTETESQES